MDNLQLQNKLINIIYYDADGFGSIKNTFDKAKMIDPTLTYETVKEWYAKNLIKKDNYKYELFGVCNHSGSTMGGHYTAYVKNANGKWYHFNDTSVSELGSAEQVISAKAYVLFYRKK